MEIGWLSAASQRRPASRLSPRASDAGNPWDKREQAKAAALARNKAAAKERSEAHKGPKKGPKRPPAVPR